MQVLVIIFTVLSVIFAVAFIYIMYCCIDIVLSLKHYLKGEKDRKLHFNIFRLIFRINKALKTDKNDENNISDVKETIATAKVVRALIVTGLIDMGVGLGLTLSMNAAVTFGSMNRVAVAATASPVLNIGSEITDDGSWKNPNPDKPEPDPDPPKPRRTKAGKAEGTFAKALDDGSYYWYHQSQYCLDCQWCGDFSDMKWGNPPGGILAKQGCAVYSLAIIASNLKGEQITPRDLLTDFGATVTKNSSGKYEANTSTCTGWIGQNAMYSDLISQMKKVYGLDSITIDMEANNIEQQIKNVIDQGGYVWIFLHNQSNHYPFIDAAHHFIVIRKYDANGFYFFDSVMGVERMNTAVPIGEFVNDVTYMMGYVNPEAEEPDEPDPIIPGNEEWYSRADSLSKYTDTIDLGNGFKLYNGLPWEPESNTYIADTDRMLIDTIDYVNKVSSEKTEFTADDIIGEGTWGYRRCINDTSVDCNVQGGNSFLYVDGGQYAYVDGIVCAGVGVPPAVLDKNYNNNWSKDGRWTYNPAADYSKYQYGTKKMAAIMQDTSTKKIYYFPCTNCDAKAHTFPGGVAQTTIALSTKSGPSSSSTDSKIVFDEIQLAKNSSGYSFETMKNVDQTQLATILNSDAFDGVKYYNFMWNVAEFWNIPNSTYSKLAGFKVIGFAIWE